MRQQTRSVNGFTLIEIMVVLSILTLLLVIIPPSYQGMIENTTLKTTTRELVSQLRLLRHNAVRQQTESQILLDLANKNYTANGIKKELDIPADAQIKLITAKKELHDYKTGAIRFYPDGSSSGGQIILSHGSRQHTINVNWLTGKISIL